MDKRPYRYTNGARLTLKKDGPWVYIAMAIGGNKIQIRMPADKLEGLQVWSRNNKPVSEYERDKMALYVSDSEKASRIIEDVSKEEDVTFTEMRSKFKSRRIVTARRKAVCRIREQTNLSYPQIGKIFKKHHSTIMSNIPRNKEQL